MYGRNRTDRTPVLLSCSLKICPRPFLPHGSCLCASFITYEHDCICCSFEREHSLPEHVSFADEPFSSTEMRAQQNCHTFFCPQVRQKPGSRLTKCCSQPFSDQKRSLVFRMQLLDRKLAASHYPDLPEILYCGVAR